MIITVNKSDEIIPYLVAFCKKAHVKEDCLEITLYDGDCFKIPSNSYDFYNIYEENSTQEEVEKIKEIQSILK